MDKMLEYFIREPEREFHVRELAKFMKKSPTTASKHLSKLKKGGLLNSRKKLNHLLFKANAENPLFRTEKLAYNLRRMAESGLIGHLVEEYNNPEAIILFGSFAKAEDIPKSDIDLLVVTPIRKEPNLQKFEKYLGHKIHLFSHSKEDIEKMKFKNKELLNSLVNGIVIEGLWEIFR